MQLISKIAALGLLCFAGAVAARADDPSKLTPVQIMNGGDSRIDLVLVRMIRNDADWSTLWSMHKGTAGKSSTAKSQAPSVDFSKNQVLAVFGGHLPDVQAYTYVKTYARDNVAVIQLGQDFLPPAKVSGVKHPFIMLVLPKEQVKTEVQLDSLAKDGSHYWMKIATIQAPK